MAEERLRLSSRPPDMHPPKRPAPITADEFDQAMTAFAPFECTPHLAVAVSGGADSMALVVLAHDWVRQRGGRIDALIVDHGLRAASANEAALTAERLKALGVDAHILQWQGPKPVNGIQAAARRTRYALLDGWCRTNGVLHLAVAHHADDQAETFMMRVRRGSGPDGLAAMAPVRTLAACRLLRPLLDFPKSRLCATLQARGIGWVEDPSNSDPKYARTAIRRELADSIDAAAGVLIATRRFARARHALETETARWLAAHATLDRTGYMVCDTRALAGTSAEIRLRVLSRAAQCIGGKAYAPEIAAVERLDAKLLAGQGATLGGAHFDPRPGGIGVFREARNLPAPTVLGPGAHHWDGRYVIALAGEMAGEMAGATVLPWTAEVADAWPKSARPVWFRSLPAKVRPGVPLIRIGAGYLAPRPGSIENNGISVHFAPTMPLSGGGFTVA